MTRWPAIEMVWAINSALTDDRLQWCCNARQGVERMTEVAAPAVDLAHLNRYTGGDRSLNDEILGLFHTQCNEIVAKLEAMVEGLDEECPRADDFSGNNKERWHKTLHTLKGAARGIGAFQLGDIAQEVGKTDPGERPAGLDALQRIREKSEAVQLFIEKFLHNGA